MDADRADNIQRAIAVMTAYNGEEGTALVNQVATTYANEPDGVRRPFHDDTATLGFRCGVRT